MRKLIFNDSILFEEPVGAIHKTHGREVTYRGNAIAFQDYLKLALIKNPAMALRIHRFADRSAHPDPIRMAGQVLTHVSATSAWVRASKEVGWENPDVQRELIKTFLISTEKDYEETKNAKQRLPNTTE